MNNSVATGENSPIESNFVPFRQSPLIHSNGKTYIGANNGGNNAFLFSISNGFINRVAGRDGAAGYDPADEGQAAVTAQITSIKNLQEAANGDIFIWDTVRLRRIDIGSGTPTITTVINYSTISGYVDAGLWESVEYDEATGWTYYSVGNNVRKIHPTHGVVTYNLTGASISGGNLRVTLTPYGLLVLQPNKRRILRLVP